MVRTGFIDYFSAEEKIKNIRSGEKRFFSRCSTPVGQPCPLQGRGALRQYSTLSTGKIAKYLLNDYRDAGAAHSGGRRV